MEAVSPGHGVRESARKLGKAVKSSYIHGRKSMVTTRSRGYPTLSLYCWHILECPLPWFYQSFIKILTKVLQKEHKVRSFLCRFAANFQYVYFNLLSYRRPYMCLVCYIWSIICYLALSCVNIMKNMLGSKCFHKSLQKGYKKFTKVL